MSDLVQTFRFVIALTLSPAQPGGKTAPPAQGSADLLGTGGFQECSGLELEADLKEYLEGGRNDGVIRRVGRVKLQPIVLKRGMFLADQNPAAGNSRATSAASGASSGGYVDDRLWDWFQRMVSGRLPIPRYEGSIQVMSPDFTSIVARWTFTRGLPAKVTGPSLNAKTGEIAIEELHIAHEGLKLERSRSESSP